MHGATIKTVSHAFSGGKQDSIFHMIHELYIIQICTIMVPTNAHKYTEISLYIQ